MIVDTHLHLIDRSRACLSLALGSAARSIATSPTTTMRAKRAGSASSRLCTWRSMCAGPRSSGRRIYVAELAAPGTAACWPAPSPRAGRKMPDFAAYLERALANPFVKGFRRVLHVMPDDLSEAPLFRENIEAACRHRPDLRPLRPAAPAHRGDGAHRSRPGCPVRARPLRRAGHQGRRARRLARADMTEIARRPNVSASSPASSPMPMPRTGRSTTCAPMSSTRSAQLRLRPHGLGQRLAGLHAGRRAVDLGRRHPCAAVGREPGGTKPRFSPAMPGRSGNSDADTVSEPATR